MISDSTESDSRGVACEVGLCKIIIMLSMIWAIGFLDEDPLYAVGRMSPPPEVSEKQLPDMFRNFILSVERFKATYEPFENLAALKIRALPWPQC